MRQARYNSFAVCGYLSNIASLFLASQLQYLSTYCKRDAKRMEWNYK